MTGVEWILLLIGGIFMIGSFFIAEKLSPSELNKIAELSEGEIKKIMDRALESSEQRIEDAIEGHIETSADKVDRALEKETNEKIMAISEYSDTVVESMNKTHNEIMFLYSMLNDKHTELTGMTSELQRLAADVRSLEENMPKAVQQPVVQHVPVQSEPVQRVPKQSAPAQAVPAPKEVKPKEVDSASATKTTVEVAEQPETVQEKTAQPEQSAKDNSNNQILALYKEGLSELEIARKLKMGVGEVRLVIGLYRGE